MPIRQRGAGWQADVIVAARRMRKDFRTEEEARKWEAETRAALEARRPPPKEARTPQGAAHYTNDAPRDGRKAEQPPLTLGDAMDRAFNKYYRGKTWEVKNYQLMQRVLDHFGKDYPLHRLDTSTVDGYVETLRNQGKSGSTINGRLAVLSRVLRFAYDRGSITRLPRIERESVHNLRLRWLNGDEEANLLRLLRQLGKDDHAEVVEVLIDTGMRQSELFALSPRDVDLKQGSIVVWQTKHGIDPTIHQRTKNGEARTIYMTDRVKAIFARKVQSAAPRDILFPFDIFWLRNAWDRVRSVMGMANDPNFVPYICRHTCASRMVQRGVPIPVIQKWMGHKTIQITMRYANVAPANLRDAAATLNMGAAD